MDRLERSINELARLTRAQLLGSQAASPSAAPLPLPESHSTSGGYGTEGVELQPLGTPQDVVTTLNPTAKAKAMEWKDGEEGEVQHHRSTDEWLQGRLEAAFSSDTLQQMAAAAQLSPTESPASSLAKAILGHA